MNCTKHGEFDAVQNGNGRQYCPGCIREAGAVLAAETAEAYKRATADVFCGHWSNVTFITDPLAKPSAKAAW